MAAEIQTGTGILFGITNDGTAISMSGFATFILDTVKGPHKFDLDAVKSETKYDAALIATNGHIELDITFTPSGATRAAAAAIAVYLAPLAKVTLNHFKVTAFNADWVYVGDASIDLSQGPAKMSLKIRKYDDATQNAALVVTTSG